MLIPVFALGRAQVGVVLCSTKWFVFIILISHLINCALHKFVLLRCISFQRYYSVLNQTQVLFVLKISRCIFSQRVNFGVQELCILLDEYWERMNLDMPIYISAGKYST